jgi:hypothetical protein
MELRLSVAENRLSDPSRVTRDIYEDYITRRGQGWVAELEGRGLGQALMAACVDWLAGLGVGEAVLETGAGTRAEAFYRRFGWIDAGRNRDALHGVKFERFACLSPHDDRLAAFMPDRQHSATRLAAHLPPVRLPRISPRLQHRTLSLVQVDGIVDLQDGELLRRPRGVLVGLPLLPRL